MKIITEEEFKSFPANTKICFYHSGMVIVNTGALEIEVNNEPKYHFGQLLYYYSRKRAYDTFISSVGIQITLL